MMNIEYKSNFQELTTYIDILYTFNTFYTLMINAYKKVKAIHIYSIL